MGWGGRSCAWLLAIGALVVIVALHLGSCASTCKKTSGGSYPTVQRCDECQPCRHGRDCRVGQHCVDGCCEIVDDKHLLE